MVRRSFRICYGNDTGPLFPIPVIGVAGFGSSGLFHREAFGLLISARPRFAALATGQFYACYLSILSLPRTSMAFVLAGISSLIYGVSDFAGGLATRRAHVLAVLVWANIVGLGIAVFVSVTHHQVVGDSVTLADLAWGAASGVAGVTGLALYFQGLAKGQMAVVAPVSAVTLALIPVLFGVATGERYPLVAWLGVTLALPALWLTVRKRNEQDRPGKALYGVAAGLTFSLFMIGIAQTSSDAGLWPLVTMRMSGLLLLGTLLVIRGIRPGLPRAVRPLAFLAGGDILANLTYLLAVRMGPFGLVTVVSSFYPVVIALLARVVEKEKTSSYQLLGLALSVLSLTLITF